MLQQWPLQHSYHRDNNVFEYEESSFLGSYIVGRCSSMSPSILPLLLYLLVLLFCLVELTYALHLTYTHTWAVEVNGDENEARKVAARNGFLYVKQIMPNFYEFRHRKVAKRSTYHSYAYHQSLAQDFQVKWLEQQVVKRRVKRDLTFTDPKWPRQWYLNREDGLNANMNVLPAWKKGFTGRDVVVTILDDGIEKNHPDLLNNYDPKASFDVNSNDPDPQPRYDYSNENRHGTRCAGEVAAQANNAICNVGIAYDAKIGGVRMLDGDVTDSVEAASLSLNPQHIDIYSASWGPDDDGRQLDGPAFLARKAFQEGVNQGRGGLGSIFIWASGNGGRDGDSCNCDGYTNSIYTLSISSTTEHGNIPWYSEACSSTLATTYSSGTGSERQIVTTDLRQGCTESHTGTSASAPIAAGICALALQANPQLSWRDMQHIVVMTARPGNLKANDWVMNGVNRKVSHSFGYGLMDAHAMVELAQNWTNVPRQHRCEIRGPDINKSIKVSTRKKFHVYSNGCNETDHPVLYLEHVQARVTMTSDRRGEMQIFLTSPMGTRSTLLARRIRDTSNEGFTGWAFMTTHSWGEFSHGTWTLEVENGDNASELKEWTLVIHGTPVHPQSKNHTWNGSANCAHMHTDNTTCIACYNGYVLLDALCQSECPSNTVKYVKLTHVGMVEFRTNACRPIRSKAIGLYIVGSVLFVIALFAIVLFLIFQFKDERRKLFGNSQNRVENNTVKYDVLNTDDEEADNSDNDDVTDNAVVINNDGVVDHVGDVVAHIGDVVTPIGDVDILSKGSSGINGDVVIN
ncbi:furin-like protease kpc-1 [Tubulanus polymorphus]|uniref:furin-like protease kpc-1 n=1 Tax=Tubulanus polymorphus TaxID=672921 RepID=UPI003DA4D9CC